jgi:hypothetical protein
MNPEEDDEFNEGKVEFMMWPSSSFKTPKFAIDDILNSDIKLI